MRRILAIGSGRAGKSTAARAIAAAAGLPLVHLDRVFWHAGWQPTPDEEWARIVDALIAEEEWVIDGNYGGTLPSRLARAEAVVFLDVPRSTCLWRVIKRAARHRSRPREDMPRAAPTAFRRRPRVDLAVRDRRAEWSNCSPSSSAAGAGRSCSTAAQTCRRSLVAHRR